MAGVFQVYEVQDDLRYFWQHWDESQAGMAAHAQSLALLLNLSGHRCGAWFFVGADAPMKRSRHVEQTC